MRKYRIRKVDEEWIVRMKTTVPGGFHYYRYIGSFSTWEKAFETLNLEEAIQQRMH